MNTTPRKRFLAAMLSLALVFGMMPAAYAADTDAAAADLKSQFAAGVQADENVDPEAWVTVVVELETKTTLDKEAFLEQYRSNSKDFSGDEDVAAYRAALVAEQNEVQAEIAKINPEAQFRYHYTNLINGFAAKVQYKDVAAIEGLDGVVCVFQTQTYNSLNSVEDGAEAADFVSLEEYYDIYGGDGIDLAEGVYTVASDAGSIDQMGLQAAWDVGYTGAGKVAAIFDSSLRYTHELFQYMDPAITAEKPDNYKTKENLLAAINANWDTINLADSGWGSWFHQRSDEETGFSDDVQTAIRNGDFWYNEKVPFAVDYMDGDLEVWDGDTGSHGTHVAGITAGNAGPVDPSKPVSYENANGVLGAAYNAQIMFFKVFSEYDDFGQESDEAVFAALDDAVTLGANSFNLSLGIPNGFTTMNTYAQHGYQMAYNRAAAAGISIAVSAGNDTRDTHPGALVNGYTTVLPNSSKVGFSGSLLGPMTVASAQGTGYSYVTHYSVLDFADFTDKDGNAVTGIDQLKRAPMYSADKYVSVLAPDTYEVVDCGDGTEAKILAATGAETLAGALDGKVALVNCYYGYIPYGGTEMKAAQANAYAAGAKAVILTFTYYNTYFNTSGLWTGDNGESIPVLGGFTESAVYTPISTYLATEGNQLFVSFSSAEGDIVTASSYSDSGPSSFTSWGVTESLKLKPDIMTPGGNILSAGAASDTALSVKSGTSMASPNMAGAFLLVQQYVDANLATFGVSKGTQEYTNLVNQLVASTAEVYAASTGDKLYFSPRRQGAGMADIAAAVNSKVVLYNGVEYNAYTGEASRTKVELGDKLADTFSFTFYLRNYDSTAREFDVLACLQTDATTKDSDGRDVLVGSSTGKDTTAIADAVMTIAAAEDGSVTADSKNINRYAAGAQAAKVSVPAESVAAITVTVELGDMTALDAAYPNGMFLEGFVFFDSAKEDVNIPFMGFRGDWTAAPIFDLATAYDDISNLSKDDLDYPIYYITTLNTVVKNGAATAETVLGANNYTGTAWPGYNYTSASGVSKIRDYLDAQRAAGSFSADFAAFSPNGDDFADIVYADLSLLRNAKALCVVITDEDDQVVTVIGPEYEYFEALASDGNGTQQTAATYGTKYNRDMAWDGKDSGGNPVEDGQYTFTVLAMTEYEYFNAGLQGVNAADVVDDTAVLAALLASETADSTSMAVKVDTTAPVITGKPMSEKNVNGVVSPYWEVTVTDASGVQALAWYYDGQLLETTPVNGSEVTKGFVLTEGNDVTKLSVTAIDYAFNESAPVSAGAFTVRVSTDTASEGSVVALYAIGGEGATYQWYQCDADGSNAVLLEGETQTTFATSFNAIGTYNFYCVVNGVQSNVTSIKIVYADDEVPAPSNPVQPEQPVQPEEPAFTDVPDSHWAADAVKKMAEKGIITGTGDGTTFSPDDSTTRAMMVTFLYRMAGSPDVSGAGSSWYAKAMKWAAAQGIINGYADGSYGEEDLVTREQLAAFLYRYATGAKAGDLSAFVDADSVSAWAADAMAWAVSEGLITGKPGSRLDPQGYATRAEVAIILSRFLNK